MDNGLFGVFYFCLGVKLDKKLDMDFRGQRKNLRDLLFRHKF